MCAVNNRTWREIQLHNLKENYFNFAQLLDYFMKNFTERKNVNWVSTSK